ncbi:ABC transporter permease [Amnibacterium sp. CER49]|jgi:peptide/nickel transport system permease protein|uniref:ABC transporter permease n=1 Tax=Amnibacterium sp. CER49 TaxID=3039161 RepID=UPI0024473881|nr:ABC transporter permease [Amnibacterium sp. CER49]MDH2445349.1 ABC transporter permease [Amnibacterium sp. CER49]
MIRFILVRFAGMILVVFIVSVLTFGIFQLAPLLSHTSPVYYYTGKVPYPPGSPQLQALIHRFGFDQPIPVQYWQFLTGIFGKTITDGTSAPVQCPFPCFGYSFRQNDLVSTLIGNAWPVTLSLCIGAAILWLVGGVLVGTFSGLKPGSFVDRAGMTGALAAVSLPIFFTGPVLLLLFVYTLGWLPGTGYVPLTTDPLGWFESMLLPWVSLAFIFAALYARLTRSNMIETMGEDYIRTARAKGLDRRTIVVKHGLRAALTPIVTIFGIDFGTLIGSTVITESVFNLRGLGYLSIQSVRQQDLPVILGVTIVAAVALVIANFIVDVLYAVIDPRVTV